MPDYAGWKMNAGVWCNDHRSLYCEHAIYFIAQREDVPYIQSAITGEKPESINAWAEDRPANDTGDLHIVVPVFPAYCVWEQLYYEVYHKEPLGSYGELSPDFKKKKGTDGVRRIMPGESAADLGATLRTTFEDDIEFYRDKLIPVRGGPPSWMKCRSRAHSVKYNTVAAKIASPDAVQGAIERNQDRELVYAMLYCYMRHQRCLFCYVNENFRDAVRVNPELAGFMGQTDEDNSNDFGDLIPQ